MLNVKVLTAKASIGDPVKNPSGAYLGEIEDILFDPKTMAIDYAVLSIDTSDKRFAVPFKELVFNGEEGYFLWNELPAVISASNSTINYQGKEYFIVK